MTEHHTVGEYLDAIESLEPATTSAIAEQVGVSRRGADKRLRQLRENDLVDANRVGNTLVWFVLDDH